jgi:hypothetical protein
VTPNSTGPDDENLSQDELLVRALGEGLSYAKAAEAVGLTKRTVQRRMDEPDFRARVASARQEAAAEALEALEGMARRAVERLSELVESENELVALKAATWAVERAASQRDTRALAARVVELERQLAEQRLRVAA